MLILAIDDTRTLRELLSHTLRTAGHQVIEAEDGVEGLEKFEKEMPHLVITDLNMPNMDGIEFTRSCRQSNGGADVPILILTTETGADLRSEARRAGASAWIVKPFEPTSLLALVNQLAA